CSQSSFNCAQSIVKNVSSLGSRAMYTASFSALGILPVGANLPNTCPPNHNEKNYCDDIFQCRDKSDESVLLCCEGGVAGVDPETSLCRKKNIPYKLIYVCDDKTVTISEGKLCDGRMDCRDKADESSSGTNPVCFACNTGEDGRKVQLIKIRHICDGDKDCQNGADESMTFEYAGASCFECGEFARVRRIRSELRCNDKMDCPDGSDESTSGINATCFDCGLDNGGLIFSELRCNGEDNCYDGRDEGGCDLAAQVGLGVGFGVICVAYVAMLVKYRDKKKAGGTITWLCSPITESVKYLCKLRKNCVYYLTSSRESNEDNI
ncbi:MAG: hypothetical protein QS748_14865, partial [Candidatus Endonucleobacter bathymodioli]|nr:hypothetical protein [Candidatus Endonucleobacter bathymodioli]